MPKEAKKAQKERMAQIVHVLSEYYPDAACALEWGGIDPWRLCVMARLSAQCTDARVNVVAKQLFERFSTVYDMAAASAEDIEEIIRPCGLYRRKAYDLRLSAEQIVSLYGGKLPDTMDELLKLSGVGRKIANLLLGDVFKKPAVVCDTHCIRICGRLGFYDRGLRDPNRIEKILVTLLDPEDSSDFCHRIVMYGREVCTARSPSCGACVLRRAGLCMAVTE